MVRQLLGVLLLIAPVRPGDAMNAPGRRLQLLTLDAAKVPTASFTLPC